MIQKSFYKSKKICEICGSKMTKLFIAVPDRNYKTGIFTYIQCLRCEYIWLSPQPKKRYLNKFYPASYRAYRPIEKLSSVQKIVRQAINKYLRLAHILIKDPLFFWKKGKILDVGAGSGHYLHILNTWGWNAYGVEVNKKAVKEGKKYGIRNLKEGEVHSLKLKSNSFDVVRYSHVLEHVSSPRKELREIQRILKPKGSIIIYIPNIRSLFFRIFRSYWYPLEAPRHLSQFSDKTIKKILESEHFTNIKIHYLQSPFPIFWSIAYLFGKKNVEKRIAILGFPFGILLKFVAFFKRTDTIEVIAQKN